MKPLKKSTLREIKKSLGRYLAILAIVALGVGFFSGLRVCRDAMVRTGDDYLNRQRMFDYRLLSTLGFSLEDAKAFETVDGVADAEGSIVEDVLFEAEDGSTGVLKVHSLTEKVNLVSLTAGRLPQKPNELVADAKQFDIDSLGTKIQLSKNNTSDTLDMFAYDTYTIVGIGNSPSYMNYERGSTSLGSGTVSGFAYIPLDGFDCDYFTEIYVRLDAQGAIYSEEYTSGVDALEGVVADSGEERAEARFEKITGEAEQELADGQTEYDDAKSEYLEKRTDAEKELADALLALTDGEQEIADNEQKLTDGEQALVDAKTEYNSGETKLSASRRKLKKAESAAYAQLDDAETDLNSKLTATKDGMAQIEQSGVLEQYAELQAAQAQLVAGIEALEASRTQLLAQGEQLVAGIAAAEAEIATNPERKEQALAVPKASKETLESEISALQTELEGLDPGDGRRIAEIEQALLSLASDQQAAERAIADTKTEYQQQIAELEAEKSTLEGQIAQAASDLKTLDSERDQAVRVLENSISAIKAKISGYESERSSLDPETDSDRIREIEGAIASLESEQSGLENQIVSTKSEYDSKISAGKSNKTALEGQLTQAAAALETLVSQRDQKLGTLENSLAQIQADIASLEGELSGLTPSKDGDRIAEIEKLIAEKRSQIDSLDQQITAIELDYDAQLAKAQGTKADLEAQYKQYEATLDAQLAAIDAQIVTAQTQLAQTQAGLQQILETGSIEMYAQLQAALPQLEEGIAQVKEKREEAKSQFSAAWSEIRSGETKLADALIQMDEAKRKLADGQTEIESAKTELMDGYTEYEEAKTEADEEFATAEQELADAEQELADARAKIDEIERPDVYVLDRTANIGYMCFESDSQIVQGISEVFPLFFFMVAALVCMTTMTRMVDEQRTQIGVLKALGYSSGSIMWKYVFYAGSAAMIGSIVGFFVGSALFPKVIWMAYDIMYGFSDLELVLDWRLGIASLAVSLICSVGATWFSVRRDLSVTPANLIRPQAPKAGQRILLERIQIIWKRLTFLQKVAIRNIFRYKKRLVMMIIGIGGCTALLVTGLGIGDSVKNVVNYQFDEITLYDLAVTFVEGQDASAQAEFHAQTVDTLADALFLHEGSAEASFGGVSKNIYLISTDAEEISSFVDLHNGEALISMPGANEAVISRGFADLVGADVGSEIIVRDSDMQEMRLTVSDVFDNYIYNYVYVRQDSCVAHWGYAPEQKTAYLNVDEGADLHATAAQIAGMDKVGNVTVNLDIRSRVNSMMDNLNYIVMMIVFSAGALAFIVLYNLTNINITERTREIATIKVLGFFPKETASYVFSENLLLCLLSALAGLPMGKLLHAFVMSQIHIDMMYFDVRILPQSYVIAIVLTFIFASLVNFVLRFKLEKINMAESLKTVE